MNAIWDIIVGWLAVTNPLGFVLMGFDKHRAREGRWRVPERTFFTLALVGGTCGILLGSVAFHHKSRKGSFIGIVLFCAILWLGGLLELARLVGAPLVLAVVPHPVPALSGCVANVHIARGPPPGTFACD